MAPHRHKGSGDSAGRRLRAPHPGDLRGRAAKGEAGAGNNALKTSGTGPGGLQPRLPEGPGREGRCWPAASRSCRCPSGPPSRCPSGPASRRHAGVAEAAARGAAGGHRPAAGRPRPGRRAGLRLHAGEGGVRRAAPEVAGQGHHQEPAGDRAGEVLQLPGRAAPGAGVSGGGVEPNPMGLGRWGAKEGRIFVIIPGPEAPTDTDGSPIKGS